MSFVKKIIILVIVIIGFFIVFWLFSKAPKQSIPTSISDAEIMELLKKNEDSNDYINKHPDFKIQDKIVLSIEDITKGQVGPDFKEVYYGLALEDNKYMKIELMNTAGDYGMVAILDLKNNKVDRAYGKILLKGFIPNPNGETTNQTTD